MTASLPTIAIVGRVNVGKSALFNRLVGSRTAIVDRTPGVTRDRNIARCHWCGYDFFVIDTGGLSPRSEDPLQEAIERQVRLALSEADAIILVVDGTAGVHPFDEIAADTVRKAGIPAFLAVNKVDNVDMIGLAGEFYSLGLGDPWPVSAMHGQGSGDLLDAVTGVLTKTGSLESDEISLAVVGRPNVGKSSIVNRLCESDRNIVTPVAGTTRDSIDTVVEWNERRFRIIDTAGLRRQSRKMDDIEFYSTLRAWKSVDQGEVVLVLLDASEHSTQQDLHIAGRAWDLGKGVIFGVNKIDLGMDRNAWIRSIIQKFRPARWIPILFLSAITGKSVGRILPTVSLISDRRNSELQTAELNRILQSAVEKVQPPSPRGKAVRFFYATQIGTRPPKILVFVNRPEDLPDNYRRYIENKFMDSLKMNGVPLKIIYRKRAH